MKATAAPSGVQLGLSYLVSIGFIASSGDPPCNSPFWQSNLALQDTGTKSF
jgi:hypothetical protein